MKRVALLAAVAVAGLAWADTIWVDDDNTSGIEDGSAAYPYNTVQEGLNAASNGDEVVVLPGTYLERVTFDGSGITADFTLRSTDPDNPAVVAATIIDGDLDGDPGTAEGSAVTFSGAETETVLFNGMTVTGGNGVEKGGGILGEGEAAEPTYATITNCVVTGNYAWYGGGLFRCNGLIEGNTITDNSAGVGGGLSHCHGVITGNVISYNVTSGNGAGLYMCHFSIVANTITENESAQDGGGLFGCHCSITGNDITANQARRGAGLSDCNSEIWGNDITGNTADVAGGGVFECHGYVHDNTISDNVGGSEGGGFYFCDAHIADNLIAGNSSGSGGGGLNHCDGLVDGNTIRDNTAEKGAGLVYCDGYIAGNTILHNTADESGGGLYFCTADIVNNLITGNAAGLEGGGLNRCTGGVISNTVCGNHAGNSGGGLYDCDDGYITNCILWGNSAPTGAQMYVYVTPTYSCIQDWTGGGDGNTSSDPAFVDEGYWTGTPGSSDWIDGDYRLLPTSSCIDSADGDLAPALDMNGNPRFDHPDVANTGVGTPPYADMGALESYVMESVSLPGRLDAGWNLMSCPLAPLCAECSEALDDCVAAGNDVTNNLFRYTHGAGYEIYPGGFTEMELGRGHWLSLDTAAIEALCGECIADDVEIALTESWNLIGHPHPAAVLYSGCQMSDGVETKSVPDAEAAGWIDPALYYYEGGGYRQLRSDGAGDDDSLRPWYGYWFLANQPGLTLIVPAP